MARIIAIARDGVIVNRVRVPDDWTGAEGEWRPEAGATAADDAEPIGAVRDGAGWRVPDSPDPPPPQPTAPELARVLLAKGTITQAELDAEMGNLAQGGGR